VTRQHGEEDRVGTKRLVLAACQRDRLGAAPDSALAEKLDPLSRCVGADLLDPLVDLAGDRLVPGDPILALVAAAGAQDPSFRTI
jgi:hypothetical protein